MRRAALIVAAGAVLFGLPMLGLQARGAGAITGNAGPIAVTVTPTAGVSDGRAVAVSATAPAGTKIYEVRARLCVQGRKLRSSFDFSFQGRRCSNAAVGGGTVERVAAFPSGVSEAELEGFVVGEGTTHWVNELGYDQTIDCGPGKPCDVVVRLQITDNTVFFTAPLCYGSSCAPEGSTPTSEPLATSTTIAPGAAAPGGSKSGSAGSGGDAESGKAAARAAAAAAAARAARESSNAATGSAAGATGTVATIAAPWPLSRTLLIGSIGAIAGAALAVLFGRLRRRKLVRHATIAGAVVVLMLVLSGCSSSAKPSTDSTTTTSQSSTTEVAGSAKITSFVVPESVTCGSAPSTTVRVSYAVTGADRVQLMVDGRLEPAATKPTATVDAAVHCDGLPHTVALVAYDAEGGRTSQVKNLTTVVPGG